MNLAAINTVLESLIADLGGLPCEREGAAWAFAGDDLGKFRFKLISASGLGNDEQREAYDPDAAIDGDIFESDPEDSNARLGGTVVTMTGNRQLVYSVTCESHDQTLTAQPYLEAVRDKIMLPSSLDRLRAVNLAVARISPSKDVSVFFDGREISQYAFEVTFNANSGVTDAAVTTIERVVIAAGPP